MKPDGSIAAIFERQWLHALFLVVALPVLWLISMNCSCFHRGEVWGINTWYWFWISIEIPIAHQIFVWFGWRSELHRDLMSRLFGEHAFTIFAVVFATLLIGRLVAITVLAISSRGSLPASEPMLRFVAALVAIPVIYLLYSVIRYFGIQRAFGVDHFDESYRSAPLVRQGIFRLTRNGMYLFGMMILYIPALGLVSRPALVASVFSHLYIWVHYFTTELPDMRHIYADRRAS